MKERVTSILSAKIGEEIHDFDRIGFDENNDIYIKPTEEEISLAAAKKSRSSRLRTNITKQQTNRLTKKNKLYGKPYRLTVKQTQKKLAAKLKIMRAESDAFKVVTIRVDQEQMKPMKDRKSTVQIRKEVMEETGVKVKSRSTINRYVNVGLVGITPIKRGGSPKIPDFILNALTNIHKASVRIMQLTGQNNSYRSSKRLVNLLKQCFQKNDDGHLLPSETWIAKRIKNETADSLGGFSSSKKSVEASRHKWLTEANLRTWAAKEEEFGLKINLMERNEEGKACWKDGVADRIVNFDETSVTVDTSEMSRGGRPTI